MRWRHNATLRPALAPGAPLMGTNVVVDVPVAAEPAFQLAMRVGAANVVDPLDIGGIDRELDPQPVRGW